METGALFFFRRNYEVYRIEPPRPYVFDVSHKARLSQ